MFGETDETVNKKVKALSSQHGMTPIVCCGETLESGRRRDRDVRDRGRCARALEGSPPSRPAQLVIAYEPIWAIGTGRTPTPEAANDVARLIRATVGALFGQPAAMPGARPVRRLGEAREHRLFMPEPDIDGALVGGAALEAALVRCCRCGQG